MTTITPLTESAWLAQFPSEELAQAWASAARTILENQFPKLDIVLAYRSVAVYFDDPTCDRTAIEEQLDALTSSAQDQKPGPLISIPVLYDGEDLPAVARHLACSVEDVIARHSTPIYCVYAIGFLPGFPYCGYLSEELAGLPRRAQPRTRVPAGSVAIAGRQTGIYPQESPGGWHLLGRTPVKIVDLAQAFFPLRAGDQIQFQPIDANRYAELQGTRLQADRCPSPCDPKPGD